MTLSSHLDLIWYENANEFCGDYIKNLVCPINFLCPKFQLLPQYARVRLITNVYSKPILAYSTNALVLGKKDELVSVGDAILLCVTFLLSE